MERYLVFAGEQWYPMGGMTDLQESGNDLQALINKYDRLTIWDKGLHGKMDKEKYDWCHIYDAMAGEIAWASDCYGTSGYTIERILSYNNE